MAQDKKIKIPLMMRLTAWWEGYDVADIEARLRNKDNAGKVGILTESEAQKVEEIEKEKWTKVRIQVTELAWGEGYCGPGGPNNVIEMAKSLTLTSEKSIMIIGSGLGGPARTLVKEHGTWVDGYETSPELTEKGMDMSKRLGLDKKTNLIQKDLNEIVSFDRQYDAAFSKEMIFTVQDKPRLFQAIYNSMKPGTLFAFTDFILDNSESFNNTDVQKWMKQEPFDPYPTTTELMINMMKKSGFSVRVKEDITDHYRGLVRETWDDAESILERLIDIGEEARESLLTVAREAKFWERRIRIMDSGDLKVMRFLVYKKAEIK